MAINKVVYGDRTLIDLTNQTVEPKYVRPEMTFYNNAGELVNGTMPNFAGLYVDSFNYMEAPYTTQGITTLFVSPKIEGFISNATDSTAISLNEAMKVLCSIGNITVSGTDIDINASLSEYAPYVSNFFIIPTSLSFCLPGVAAKVKKSLDTVSVYSGTDEPDNSVGNDGDIYVRSK